jgi:hypothetical protein
MAVKRTIPKMATTKWLSARQIRQEACLDLLSHDDKILDEHFFEAPNQKRADYDKQLCRTNLVQIIIVGILMVSILHIDDVSITIFGFSIKALSKVREFILFCYTLALVYAVILQQHVHKLEDFLVGYSRHHADSPHVEDNDTLKIFVMRFLTPFDTLNLAFLPSRKNLFYNKIAKTIFWINNVSRGFAAFGFLAFIIAVPIIAAARIYAQPNYGWISTCTVIYWAIASLFSLF